MENTVLAVISRQMGIQSEMDAVANNMANLSTSGFKNERIQFEAYLQNIGNNQTMSFVKNSGVIRDFSDGPLQYTSNPLDIAIRGEGFLQVETEDGILYTRAGRIHLDPTGMMVNADGMPYMGDDGLPILTFPGDTLIEIASNGGVTSESGVLGQLALVEFDDLDQMDKLGNGLYKTNQDPNPAEETTIVQGALEGSNVDPISEMTRMITLLRSYQGSQTLGNEEHDLRRKAIGIVGSVNQTA